MTPIERVLDKLHGLKVVAAGEGNLHGWMALCPTHADHTPSLHVTERDDYSVGIWCYGGCEQPLVLDALGLKFADLFPPDVTGKNGHKKRVLVKIIGE